MATRQYPQTIRVSDHNLMRLEENFGEPRDSWDDMLTKALGGD